MFDKELLENLEWYIETKPSIKNIKFRDTMQNITKNTFDQVVLNFDHDIELNFPLNNNYSVFKKIIIKGKQTIKSLFKTIYDFYDSELDPGLADQVYEDYDDYLQELLIEKDNEPIYNIDALNASECAPDFVGLRQDTDNPNLFTVDLGPI